VDPVVWLDDNDEPGRLGVEIRRRSDGRVEPKLPGV
jgi:hypothetical protein